MLPPASIATPSGWRSRGSLKIPSKKTSTLSRGSMGSKVLFHLRAGGTTGLSGGDLGRYGLVWIREALFGHERVTARVSGVPVVWVSSQLFVKLCVFVQLVPVQADTQPGDIGDLDRATLVLEPDEAIVGLHLDYGAHEASPVGPAGMLERRLQWDRYDGRSYVGYLQGSSYATAGLFRQSYPEGCEQTAVDPVICSRHKARLRACEEADHLGDLFWPGNPSQGMHPAPVLDRRLDGVLPLEEIRRPSQHRCVNRTRTHSIDPYVLFGVIQGHRPC